MIIDQLYDNVARRGHVCVGLDTGYDYLPQEFADKFSSVEDGLFEFNRMIIDATIDVAACYKIQIAYYEAEGLAGLSAYRRTLHYLRKCRAIAIADIKRCDISKTAEMYAKAHFTGDFEADFVTLNPYMGFDSIVPYFPYIQNSNKGIFILIRTSNEGAKDIQYQQTAENGHIFDLVGQKVNEIGRPYLGKCGYSSIGGVMGCTHADEAAELRATLDSTFFLIPGYGAQGGKGVDIARYLHDGNGGIVNSSRNILLAYRKQPNGDGNFADCARAEVLHMRDDIHNAIASLP